MTFLSPLYLLGAVAAAVPILLHFLHRQPELRVKFAAVRLLRQAPVEDTRRRRIREWLLLALRVAALVLIALAFARPFLLTGAAARSGVTIVALDTSLSMSGQARFDRAKQLALDAVDKAPRGNLIGLVTFDDAARNAVAPTADRALVRAAIESAAPGFGGTRYAAALNAAAQMAAGSSAPSVVIVTDLQASGWDAGGTAALPEGARVSIGDVGPLPANLAVTDAAKRANRLVAAVRNSAASARDAHVTLSVDGKRSADASVSVPAGGSADVELAAPDGEAATISVEDPGGIQADNVRYLLLAEGGGQVLLVTADGNPERDAFYVDAALTSGSPSAFHVVALAGAALGAANADVLTHAAAIVLLSTRGIDPAGRARLGDFLRKGGGLVAAAGPDVDEAVLSEILGGALVASSPSPAADAQVSANRHLAPTDVRHPIFQAFQGQPGALSLSTFRQIVPLASKQCSTIAAFTTGEPALLDCTVGAGRALVLASDADNRGNDFPLHASFVPFLQESVRYVSASREPSRSILVGESDAARNPGFVTVQSSSGPRRVAVNVNPAESDADRLSPDEFLGSVARLRQAGRSEAQARAIDMENRQHVWQYILGLAIVALILESTVSARTA